MKLNGQKPVNLRGLKILDDIKEVYYENTGMIISFYYPDRNKPWDDFPKKQKNEFCKIIQSTDEGFRRCLASDRRGFAEARQKDGYCIYRCHASLTDVSIPLIYEGRDLGGIYTGQVLLEDPTDASFDHLYGQLHNLNLGYERLKQAYFRVKVVDRERLSFCVKLLTLIANYIITVVHELQLQCTVIEKDRELYRKERERMKLEKALKDLSISVLAREKGQGALSIHNSESQENNDRIVKAQEFIRHNYNNNIRLDNVATAVFLSPNYFSTLFRKVTGYTFSTYLMKLRIQAARDLLKQTSIPIKKIVYQVGFEDYNYFNRTFKRFEGIPPAQYRKAKGISAH
jgi:AraC-like DNA-binding protein/ligand-binding sensor protein